jgi:hypothetical protein
MNALLDEFIKQASRQGNERKKQIKQYALYSAVGGTAAPTLKAISSLIESGKLPEVKGKYFGKVPSWIPAAAATGAMGGGLIPLARDYIKHHKKHSKLEKRGQGIGHHILKPVHQRWRLGSVIPEYTKRHAQGLLKATMDRTKINP